MSRRRTPAPPADADDTASWTTPADLLKAGVAAEDIRCVVCEQAAWDGTSALSARPLCPACRDLNGRLFRAAIRLILADAHRDAA